MRYYTAVLIFFFFIGCNDDIEEPFSSDNAVAAFEKVWSDFDSHYSYFDLKGVNWDSVKEYYGTQINNKTSDFVLDSILKEMTLVLKDVHVSYKGLGQQTRYRKRELYPQNKPVNILSYLSDVEFKNNRVIFGNINETEIAYLRFETFGGSRDDYPEINAIVEILKDKESLIVDVRENWGGNEDVCAAFVERIIQQEISYETSMIKKFNTHENDY